MLLSRRVANVLPNPTGKRVIILAGPERGAFMRTPIPIAI